MWIFDAVEPQAVQISPSKWQPHHALRPSPSAPSAFTTPTQNSLSSVNHNSGSNNSTADCSPDGGIRQCQLKLSFWAMDMTIVETIGNCPPKNVDAVVFRASADNTTVDEYYDEVGDFKVELARAFNLARL